MTKSIVEIFHVIPFTCNLEIQLLYVTSCWHHRAWGNPWFHISTIRHFDIWYNINDVVEAMLKSESNEVMGSQEAELTSIEILISCYLLVGRISSSFIIVLTDLQTLIFISKMKILIIYYFLTRICDSCRYF